MKKITAYAAASLGALLLLSACGEEKMKVTGEIRDAADKSLVLEKSDYAGRWFALDSTRVGSDGRFTVTAAPAAGPEIYRIVLDGRYIYLPVDSTETITVSSSLRDFGTRFTLSGSAQAERMARFDSALLGANLAIPDSAEAFKRRVYSEFIQEGNGSVVGYYILTKVLPDGRPLFDSENPDDARYFAAVATQFREFRPGDPHGKLLEEVSLRALRARNRAQGRKTVIEAGELKVLDIALPDENGKTARLSDMVGKGSPVVVFFSMMNGEGALGLYREMQAFSQAHPGVRIYNVSFDEDQYAWRESARNVPWTTVCDPGGHASSALRDYNVSQLPAFFIYDSAGDLADRAGSVQELGKLWTGKTY